MKKSLLLLLVLLSFSLSTYAAVDLNTATKEQLETLSGVGPSKAQAIIDYRKKNGNFKSVNDLDNVPGFGAKTIEGLKKDVMVGNAKAAASGKPTKEVKAADKKK